MNRRRLMLAFLVYVTIDLSNPFVPGAFNFNPDDCVESIHRTSSSPGCAGASLVPARAPVARLGVPLPSPLRPLAAGRHALLEWLVEAREEARASGDPPQPSEDH